MINVSVDAPPRPPRRPAALVALALVAILLFAGFCALGTWQVHRRAWKLDLIERVQARVHAPAVEAPGPDRWPSVDAANDEYRHVRASGVFLQGHDTYVQASTELGSGFWLLTPLRRQDGTVILINRGFVPPDWRSRAIARPHAAASSPVATLTATSAATSATTPTAAETTVTGLLRMPEPGGGFLQDNDPAGDRWFSRDVQAIASARGLSRVAPYFVDAQAAAAGADRNARTYPAGGLTVIAFPNNHLVYAITWYALAVMVAIGAWFVVREERGARPRGKA